MSNEELCVLARNGSIDARNQLLENNLAFIQQQANQFIERYGDNRLDVDDLIQEGCFGLMEAISRFVPERGTKFLTYAVWWIRKFMQESVSIVTASDEISLDELEDFSLPQAYGKLFCKRKPTPNCTRACGRFPPGSGLICSTATVSPMGTSIPFRRLRRTSN